MNKSKIALAQSVIIKSGIALLAVMFVLGLAACPDAGGDKKPITGNDAVLTAVKFAGLDAVLGTPSATYAGITAPGSITLLSGSRVTVAATARDSKATIQYAKVTGSETPDFFYDTTFDYEAAGDALAIEVTAADNKTRLYYRINVTVADVALQSLTIGGKTPTPALPVAATTWQTAIAGSVLFAYPVGEQPAGGLTVIATTATEGATVEYGHAVGTEMPTFNSVSSITFLDGEFLYIRVTSATGSVAYYKVAVNFQMEGVIKYGSPQIADNVIDPLWNNDSLQVYPIVKPYPQDCSADFMEAQDTFGEAKALWDENGLYLYVKVTDPDVSEVDNEHESDSIELFVNEAYPTLSYAQGGSQYRLGVNGQISGEGGSTAAMAALNKTSAWKTEDGYVVIFQVPWRLRNRFPITDGKSIGFEIQINAAPETGSRYGVMVWNNVAHTNFQNANDYGVAVLDATGHTLNWPAVPPAIDTQPVGGIVSGGEEVTLTVAASVLPANGGTLSYQWYSADTSSGEGEAIAAATGASYTFNAPAEEGRYYYYVIVTNTLNGTTAATRSASAAINVSNVVMIEQLTLAEQYAIYRFTLPAGEEFANYTAITVDYRMDQTNLDVPVRSLRLHGDYSGALSSFVNQEGWLHFAFDASNAAYIYDDIGAGAIADADATADEWFTLTYRLVDNVPNGGFQSANKPADDATGPFYFGVGIPGGAGGDSTAMPKTQLVKNIKMVHASDPSKNADGEATTMFVGAGDTRIAASGREWVPDPDSSSGILMPVIITNLTPAAYGDGIEAGVMEVNIGDDHVVNILNTITRKNAGISYAITFPDDLSLYDKIEIYYDCTIVANENSENIQLTTKAGVNSFNNDIPNYNGDNYSQYRNLSEGTDQIMNAKVSSLIIGDPPTAVNGISFLVNNWGSGADVAMEWEIDFKVTKIVISPAE